jgi:hypothetical protein
MSQDCGASGAYGILLSASENPEILALSKRLDEALAGMDPEAYVAEEDLPEVVAIGAELVETLRRIGIEPPAAAALMWTGSEDDRPARCSTPAESWVFGFGLFSYHSPNEYPPMSDAFKAASQWHTWCWVG